VCHVFALSVFVMMRDHLDRVHTLLYKFRPFTAVVELLLMHLYLIRSHSCLIASVVCKFHLFTQTATALYKNKLSDTCSPNVRSYSVVHLVCKFDKMATF